MLRSALFLCRKKARRHWRVLCITAFMAVVYILVQVNSGSTGPPPHFKHVPFRVKPDIKNDEAHDVIGVDSAIYNLIDS
jgi:hypothetical protein